MGRENFIVKFHGVRGGYPKPGPATTRFGGNTTCIGVLAGSKNIIVDAGTGIISWGREMMNSYQKTGKKMNCSILMTHFHHDHTQGLPFFAPFFHPDGTISFFGANPNDSTTMEEELLRLVKSPSSPLGLEKVHSKYQFYPIYEGDRIVLSESDYLPLIIPGNESTLQMPSKNNVMIEVLNGRHHPKDGVLVYRVNYCGRSLVVATDIEGFVGGDQRLIDFSQGADLLIHDAEYEEEEYCSQEQVRQGWGHSTWSMAVEVAQAANVKRLALFHHNVDHDDNFLEIMEQKAKTVFKEAFMAKEGLEIVL